MLSNPRTATIALSIALIIALLALPFLYPTQVRDSPRQQWEYLIEAVPDILFEDTMDTYGRDGWELVFARRARSTLTDSFSYEVIFKRPQVGATSDSSE